MGRPREHDATTAAALLRAAERTVEDYGVDAVAVRDVARAAGTSTRAVYSLFGSKDGLLGALGIRAFELLQRGLAEAATTQDPREDLLRAALMFRRFALTHPALFAIGIQRSDPASWPLVEAAQQQALVMLQQRIQAAADAGYIQGRAVPEATVQFHALCEGLAALELRAKPQSPPQLDERIWRNAFDALMTGFAHPPP